VLKRALTENPKIIGFSLIFQRMLPDFADLIRFLRTEMVGAHFTAGGHFPSIEFEKTMLLMPELDTVIRHEGEETMWELYQNLPSPHLWPQVKGLVYREDGHIKSSPPRPLIKDLDSLPFPVRSENLDTHRGVGMCSIIASRGCYYNCSFCSIHEFYREAPGPKRRSRSPANVAKEMEYLFSRGVRIFNFKDDDLGTKGRSQRKWIEDFISELKSRGLADEILWRISCRIDEVNSELIGKLMEVGLQVLYLGIESGSEKGLMAANKHYKVEDIYRALNVIRDLGLKFEYGFMLFDPFSTFDTVRENIALLEDLGKNGKAVVRFTKMFPYVGTDIARRLKKEGRMRGSIESPDYNFEDPRMDLLEVFASQAFHNMIFEEGGLTTSLQSAKFDSIVLDRFFRDSYNTESYAKSIADLTKRCNQSSLETLRMAVEFMDKRSYEDILYQWNMLDMLARQELTAQREIKADLDELRPVKL
jgi:anaerobic magnesium-protoporphyrin IX monomethyl ester cyclase